MRDNVTDIGVWRRWRQGIGIDQEIATLERRTARAFVDYQLRRLSGRSGSTRR